MGIKTHNNAPRHISRAFCRLGLPEGSRSGNALSFSMCSAGFPLKSEIRTAMLSRMPTMASWLMGFWSKYSRTKSMAYEMVRRCLVGIRSFSAMAKDMSMTKTRCRMIPRWMGVVSRSTRRRFSASRKPSRERSSHAALLAFFLRLPPSTPPLPDRPPPAAPRAPPDCPTSSSSEPSSTTSSPSESAIVGVVAGDLLGIPTRAGDQERVWVL
ncbi:hypothetical protein PpBr36_07181 [Pyricularia pennisetigena]|uniref:hypothetical protein n=1 Tax=Pyricularia pennisetigena TaxID=1578925 RepID=UPI00114E7932|nr:hypothetical protein PpBr36_07181 [Pyricularia pennisetigena]TLS25932.1 hypothetical protein PpBr36_07181 [Pyricularia pennisetigena]